MEETKEGPEVPKEPGVVNQNPASTEENPSQER